MFTFTVELILKNYSSHQLKTFRSEKFGQFLGFKLSFESDVNKKEALVLSTYRIKSHMSEK